MTNRLAGGFFVPLAVTRAETTWLASRAKGDPVE